MSHNKEETSLPRKILNILIPVLLLAAGGAAWAYFQSTAPSVKRKPAARQTIMVDVLTVTSGEVRPVIKTMGDWASQPLDIE